MTARAREKDDEPLEAAEPLDPAFVERCRQSLADPRPDIPAAEVRAYLNGLHEARLKRGA
jgi:phosphoglycolate phosphatase-like HAD superfamily hydrolase